ncbi:hypothetical protein MASR2M78_28620 [Treponema sp.]
MCTIALKIPLVYLPVSQLREKLETALIKAYTSFGMIAPPYVLKRMTDDLFSKESIDFGRLDEESQTDIIETLCSNTVARVDVADANPFLAGLSSWEPDEALIAQNRERVLTAYSAAASLAQLFSAYTAATEKNITQRLSKAILLELFLDPLKLSLVGAGND